MRLSQYQNQIFRFLKKDIKSNKNNFKADSSILENFTGHTVLNKAKLAKHLCKIVTSIDFKEINLVTNIGINKDTDDFVSQCN